MCTLGWRYREDILFFPNLWMRHLLQKNFGGGLNLYKYPCTTCMFSVRVEIRVRDRLDLCVIVLLKRKQLTHSRRINSTLIVCVAPEIGDNIEVPLHTLVLLLPFSMGSDLLHVHEWMPCHNGGKLEHAGQSGHLIPAAKPSQAKEEDEEVIRVGNVDKLEELIGGF